jgi:isopentenyl phosphate kinase
MKDLILLKIGGSVCTEKSSSSFKVRSGAVAKIAREIVEAKKTKDFRLLVANGAGPFGHVNVNNYAINNGLERPEDFEGFSKTVSDCHYLNWKVSEIMRKAGLLTVAYPTTSVVIGNGRKITTFFTDVLKRLWDANEDIVPVMNGDMIADLEYKGTPLSGDSVLEHLAKRFNPKLMVFVTDVDGIFTSDPNKDKKAKLVEYVTKQNFDGIKKGISGSSNVDVTGGMLGKVEKLLSLDNRTVIVNGNVPGRAKSALLGEDVRGTVIG